jgi:hypothetical protein
MGIEKLIVDIDADLKKDFKSHAAKKGSSMKEIVEKLIKEELKDGEQNG